MEELHLTIAEAHGIVVTAAVRAQAKRTSAYEYIKDNGVQRVEGGPYVAIEVDTVDKRFVLADGIITHNCIFFNDVLLRGNRAKKLDPGTVNPFSSPNFPPLAEMGVRINLKRELILQAPRRKFQTHKTLFGNIVAMLLVPGFDDIALEAFLKTSTKEKPACLVLMLYGAGNAPSQKKGFLSLIGEGVSQRGAIVVITSQCLHGSVDMSQYATGHALKDLGVIDGRDMTTEATVTKLAYLVGRGLRGAQLKSAMESNLRGELTTRRAHEYTQNQNQFSRDIDGAAAGLGAIENVTPAASVMIPRPGPLPILPQEGRKTSGTGGQPLSRL